MKVMHNNGYSSINDFAYYQRTLSPAQVRALYNGVECNLDAKVEGDYAYGWQGWEKDDEIKGTGNSYDFGARLYDPRLGRWLSIDPLFRSYPSISPYTFGVNNPIFYIDYDGRDVVPSPTFEENKNNMAALEIAYESAIIRELVDLFASDEGMFQSENGGGKLKNHTLFFGTNSGRDAALTNIEVWDPEKEKFLRLKLRKINEQITKDVKFRLRIDVVSFLSDPESGTGTGEKIEYIIHELMVHAVYGAEIIEDYENSAKSEDDLTKLRNQMFDWVDAGKDAEHTQLYSGINKKFNEAALGLMTMVYNQYENEENEEKKSEIFDMYKALVTQLHAEQEGGNTVFAKMVLEHDENLRKDED